MATRRSEPGQGTADDAGGYYGDGSYADDHGSGYADGSYDGSGYQDGSYADYAGYEGGAQSAQQGEQYDGGQAYSGEYAGEAGDGSAAAQDTGSAWEAGSHAAAAGAGVGMGAGAEVGAGGGGTGRADARRGAVAAAEDDAEADGKAEGAAAVASAEATALRLADAPGLMQFFEKQEQLQAMTINQNTLQRLPKTVVRRLDGLRLLDEEYQRIHSRLVQERKELEAKYYKRFMPLLMQRTEIINKRLDPADIDIKEEDTDNLPIKLPPPAARDSDEDDSSDDDIVGSRGVPGFWLQAMSNNEVISQLITERDEAALAHLNDIRVENLPGMEGFKIIFHFTPNKFFTNSELVKTFYIPNMFSGSEPMLERVEGSAVKWKKGRNLTLIPVKERSRVKEMGKRKTITRLKPCESFFNIFSGPILSGTGANEHDDHEELLNQIDADFEIGLTFKDKIVPRGFAWYTGEAAAGSSDDESDLGEDEDDAEFRNMFSSGPNAVSNANDPGSSEEEDVTREEIRLALAEAFKAKIPAARPSGGRASRATDGDADASATADGAPPVEKPDECKTQ